ncbi:MAG: PAS domain-containing sensor histidine kinase [Acidobacteriota bacterium]
MTRKLPIDRLSFRITCGLVLALFLVGIPFFVFFYRLHERQLAEGMRKPVSDLSQLILAGLERRMLEHQPHLLDSDIRQVAAEAGGARIMLVDKEGQIRFSTDAQMAGRTFSRLQGECSSCHSQAPVPDQFTVVEPRGREFARSMLVIRNKESCFNCHPPNQKINGTLIVDLPMSQAGLHLRSDMREMLGLAGLMVTVTILAIVLLVDRLIVRRIKAMERTTIAIRKGSLDERVVTGGHDEISELACSFNVMTASLKESLKETERHKEYLENIINSIEDEIVVVDRDFRVVKANQAYLRRSGYPKETAPGQPCCITKEGRNCEVGVQAKCPARTTFQSGRVEKCLYRFVDDRGRERYIEIYSYPLIDASGRIYQVIEVRRDITERRALEANLCHSERLASLGLLASGISHEINNPLASIMTCAEGLQKRIGKKAVQTKGDMAEYLALITKEAMRAKAITERLLILARKSDSLTYIVSVNRALEETVQLVRFQAQNREIEIQEEYARDLPEIKADEPALRQVFLNLLINAIQATNAGGRIGVGTARERDSVRVVVEDTGCGISPADLPHLFEPFFSKRPVGQGTGLGLFISNTLIRQMGGSIQVDSQVGQGSRFVVELPFEPTGEPCPDTHADERWIS